MKKILNASWSVDVQRTVSDDHYDCHQCPFASIPGIWDEHTFSHFKLIMAKWLSEEGSSSAAHLSKPPSLFHPRATILIMVACVDMEKPQIWSSLECCPGNTPGCRLWAAIKKLLSTKLMRICQCLMIQQNSPILTKVLLNGLICVTYSSRRK
jgi:hypothetical protein